MVQTVRKATRKKAKMRLGIAATAGAGKTMGALLVAYGLTGDWGKVGLIDTESGSGELYVNHRVPGTNIVIGEYLYCRIDPPFTVAKYIESQKALEDAACEAIIHDSTTHAWSGAGGLLDKQGKIAAKSGNSYTAWRDVTPDHNLFVETMLSSPAHIIATMRSKTEYVLETNDKGKQAPRKVGMAPVQREGMDFEFTIMLDVDANHMASATKDRTSLFDGEFFKLSPDVGKKMLGWLNAGVEPTRPITLPSEEPLTPFEPDPMDALRERVSAVIQTLDKQHDIASVEKVMRLAQGLLADCDATEGAADLRTRLVDAFDAARERVDPVSDAAEPESMEMGMPE
jgi:hypothetical protein